MVVNKNTTSLHYTVVCICLQRCFRHVLACAIIRKINHVKQWELLLALYVCHAVVNRVIRIVYVDLSR